MVMATLRRMSVEEFLELPESKLVHQLIDGKLVVNPPPTYRHEAFHIELIVLLHSIIGPRRDLVVLGPFSALRFGPTTILSPDIFICRKNPANPNPDWADVPIPLLAIEILSPSTATRDRTVKRDYYQRAGVEEYWIVDTKARRIERWHPTDEHPEMIAETLRFSLSVGLQGEIDLKELFDRVER
jgi:Uma2 family endonuclease